MTNWDDYDSAMDALNAGEAPPLTETQLTVLEHMGGGELSKRLDYIAADTQLSKDVVRRTCRELKTLGLAEYTVLIREDDGLLAGWGYWRNSKGCEVLDRECHS